MTDSRIDEIRARLDEYTLGSSIELGYDDIAYLLDQLAAKDAEIARKDAALSRLIADYEDVPDATDTDGQQVFTDARAALGDKP